MDETYRELVNDFVHLLRERFGEDLVSVVLYGSVATGRTTPASDVDLCVVVRNLPRTVRERTKLMAPLVRALRARAGYRTLESRGYVPEAMPILFTPEEIRETKPLFLDMVDDGVVLVDDGTFSSKLAEIRRRMKELGTRRVTLEDGTRYWILKPDVQPGEVVML